MVSDYTRIRESNLRQYGEGVRHLAFLGRLYADRTHFIFELLQNAEDAGASSVTFDLHPNRLQVSHDGRPFTTDDVIGICGVDDSTKSAELTAIGKFGIGFKSVYAYTDSPEIHSVDEHFRIEHYVRPHAVNPRPLAPRETVFVLPFDRKDVPPETAHQEIVGALQDLNPVALLFLHSISTVNVRVAGHRSDRFTRVTKDDVRVVEVVHERGDRVIARPSWLRFSRPLTDLGHPQQRVEIAWRRTRPEHGAVVQRIPQAPLVAFFPTDRTCELGFLLQAPFRTTPARDNIAEHDEWNKTLIDEGGRLLVDALIQMANEGRLGIDILQALPLQPDYFPNGSLLRPVFDVLQRAFAHHPLLPTASEGYVPSTRARLARGTGLRELLNPEQLANFCQEPNPVYWLPASVTEVRTPLLLRYLRHTLDIDEVTPEWLVSRLTDDFLKGAPDEWLTEFYAFLNQNPALWRDGLKAWQVSARRASIIRLETGQMTKPFTETGHPLAYLPSNSPTNFPTVRKLIAADPRARAFLVALGLTEPNAAAEVTETVIPFYTGGEPDKRTDMEIRAQHLDLICRALKTSNAETRGRLVQLLRKTPFLLAEDAAGSQRGYCRPTQAYWPDNDTAYYFAADSRARFLSSWYEPWRPELDDLGVATRVRVSRRRPNPAGYVVLQDSYAEHRRGLNGFDPDFDIDGLAAALKAPSLRRSAYIWNELLIPHIAQLRGTVESATRQDYTNRQAEEMDSAANARLKECAWLPDPAGGFVKPSALALTDLPPEFKNAPLLATALDMVSPVIEQASQQLGVSSQILRFLADNPEAVRDLERKAKLAEVDEPIELPAPVHLDYAAALQASFQRSGHDEKAAEIPGSGTVLNSERRRQRTRAEIEAAQHREPHSRQRFRRVTRNAWERKNNAVRHFLLAQYGGHCQICNDTFAKRNGEPYFEGLHLVPYTRAAWTDRAGGVVCLCPTCCSKFLYGAVEADDVPAQIMRWRPRMDGGADPVLHVELCGDQVSIHYTEKHLLDLQTMLTTNGRQVDESVDGGG